jgi:hypothetical protein
MRKLFFVLPVILFVLQLRAQIGMKSTEGSANYPGAVKDKTPPVILKKQSMFSMSIADLAFTNITLKYELFRKDGKVSITIPFSFNAGGIPDTNDYNVHNSLRFISSRNRIFQTGFAANYFLDKQDAVYPYIGATVAAGWFYYWKYSYVPGSTPPFNTMHTSEKLVGNNYSFAFHYGLLFNPWETVTFNTKIGFGLRRFGTIYQEYTVPFALFDLTVGIKF